MEEDGVAEMTGEVDEELLGETGVVEVEITDELAALEDDGVAETTELLRVEVDGKYVLLP